MEFYVQKIRKLADRRLAQHVDDLEGEGLHRGQGAVPFPHQLEHAAIKLELKLIVYFAEVFFKHRFKH